MDSDTRLDAQRGRRLTLPGARIACRHPLAGDAPAIIAHPSSGDSRLHPLPDILDELRRPREHTSFHDRSTVVVFATGKLPQETERLREQTGLRRYVRADAAFAKPDIYEYLEERHVFYAIRLPSNKVLQYEIAPLLIRPVGRPPKRPVILYDDFWYRAGSWDRARRVVAKVEWHRGELFPRVGFIVTNMTAGPEGVVRFYNGRGTAEQWIKEGKYALSWTRLSCHRFVANRVRLSLFVLA